MVWLCSSGNVEIVWFCHSGDVEMIWFWSLGRCWYSLVLSLGRCLHGLVLGFLGRRRFSLIFALGRRKIHPASRVRTTSPESDHTSPEGENPSGDVSNLDEVMLGREPIFFSCPPTHFEILFNILYGTNYQTIHFCLWTILTFSLLCFVIVIFTILTISEQIEGC